MKLSFSKIFSIIAVLAITAVFSSCDQKLPVDDPTTEEIPGGEEGKEPEGGENQDPESNPGQEPEVPVDPVEPVNPDVISSAVLTFAYIDLVGEVDVENKRVDFDLEVYGSDPVNLRYVPVTFTLKDGYKTQGTNYEYIRLILTPEDQPAKVTFAKGEDKVEYEVYLDLEVKEAPRTDFEFKRGVNLSYWFQDPIPWYDDPTIDEVSYYGFDHVRIPFDTKVMFNEDGSVIRDRMDMLHYVVQRCIDKGLNVILDMHWLNAGNMFYEPDAAEELVNNWNRLIQEFSKYPVERVAYEVLNEPHGDGWVSMQRNMLHMIRHYEPSRVVFISPQGFHPDSVVPFSVHGGDPNLVVTFHYYDPMLASHRKLWGYNGPSHYPGLLFTDEEWDAMSEADQKIAAGHKGRTYDYDFTYGKFKAAADNPNLQGLRLHCGEFGFSHRNDREDRLQWFRDVVKAFNEFDIAYTTWENWGGDFGPGDWQSRPDEEVIDILMQRE